MELRNKLWVGGLVATLSCCEIDVKPDVVIFGNCDSVLEIDELYSPNAVKVYCTTEVPVILVYDKEVL